MFPLYKNDGFSAINLSKYQRESLNRLIEAINDGSLKMIDNYCLCKNNNPEKDIVISEKDRYGIPVGSILCSRCGLIRSNKIFDESSNNLFYEKFYRDLYVGQHIPDNKFFKDQICRGENFLSLINKNKILDDISDVFEIGCGAGGIIYPFYQKNKNCIGFDYNEDYLKFGRKFGLNLILGDWNKFLKDDSADLIILSHVMEHFTDPIKEVGSIIQKIKPGKYLLVEVPGIFYINKVYLSPLFYLQNAHVYNYYYEYLNSFFTSFNLEVVCGDEHCVFLLKKPKNWVLPDVECIYYESLSRYSEKISKYLIKTNNTYKKFKYLNLYFYKNIFSLILSKIGLKKIIKKLFKL